MTPKHSSTPNRARPRSQRSVGIWDKYSPGKWGTGAASADLRQLEQSSQIHQEAPRVPPDIVAHHQIAHGVDDEQRVRPVSCGEAVEEPGAHGARGIEDGDSGVLAGEIILRAAVCRD